jgi:hypothetical protein
MSPVLDMGGLPERGAEERVDVRTGAVRLLGGELIAAAEAAEQLLDRPA